MCMIRARIKSALIACFAVLISVCVLCSCGESDTSTASSSGNSYKNHEDGVVRETNTEFLMTEAPGDMVESGDNVAIDYSNANGGYIMVQYLGSVDKVKVQITGPDATTYTYTIMNNEYQAFPLTAGNGHYTITANEHIEDSRYALICTLDIDVAFDNEFLPFLVPNQYSNYTADSKPVQYGIELSNESSNDLDYVDHVYNYVISTISYDTEKAENIGHDYIPDIDDTFETKKGICFDYASVMTAMLRSQNIPTKLEVGYSGDAYHAWISVYIDEIGWVDNIIEFDGSSWSLMDPTLAANDNRNSVKSYVGDGSHYTVKYEY